MFNDLELLNEVEREQVDNFDATPIEELEEPVPQWQKDVERITLLLS